MSSLARPRLRGVIQSPPVAAVVPLLRVMLVAPRDVVVRARGGGLDVPGKPLQAERGFESDLGGLRVLFHIEDKAGESKPQQPGVHVTILK